MRLSHRVWLFVLAASSFTATARAADGDPVAGKAIFVLCAACHTAGAGGADLVGPNLHGIFGKTAGTNRKSFDYSRALKESSIVWDDATIDAWIKNPVGLLPGTKMEYVGLTKKEKRANLIAYLKEATK